jgi:ATP-dependent DNA helicase RecQ
MATSDPLELICRRFCLNSLTPRQKSAINGIRDGKDVFVGTKTGSGKSLIYECAPVLLGEDTICVVVAPLLSIMKEQTDRLNALGFKATYIGKDSRENLHIQSGYFQFVFGSPELLLGDAEWRNMFSSDVFRRKLRLIVVDEAHTVVQW